MTSPAPDVQAGLADKPRRSSKFSAAELGPRIVAALVLMAAALAAAWAGGLWFAAFWLIAAFAVHWEWQKLIGGPAFAARMTVGGLGLAAAAVLASGGDAAFTALVLLIAAAAAALVGDFRRPSLLAAAGVVYSGAMLACACLLRASRPDGLYAILWLFAVVWGTDVMAFFGGRLIGGPKLWPRLSPAKTWSGFCVGVVCGAAAGLIALPASNSGIGLFIMGLAAGAVAQGGDLFESALKRRFGVKDTSRLIPGHGGLMDRLDGFTAAAIFAAFVGLARYGSAHIAAGVFQW